MKLTKKIRQAIILAAQMHQGQARKNDKTLPYIIHPYSVALILSEYTQDENIICAGLLHDVLEDATKMTMEQIKEKIIKDFGKPVLKIIKQVSEDKDPRIKQDQKATWENRKKKYLNNLKNNSQEALLVCAADKIHNLGSMIQGYQEQGEKLWEVFNASRDKKLWFYEEVVVIIKNNLESKITAELETTFKNAKKIFKVL